MSSEQGIKDVSPLQKEFQSLLEKTSKTENLKKMR